VTANEKWLILEVSGFNTLLNIYPPYPPLEKGGKEEFEKVLNNLKSPLTPLCQRGGKRGYLLKKGAATLDYLNLTNFHK